MAYGKKNLMLIDQDTLMTVITQLQARLKKKNLELSRTRERLRSAKARVLKMKDTAEFQRKRILELSLKKNKV